MTRDAQPRPVTDASGHAPVLLTQVLGVLDPQPGQTVVDLTAGRGGHAVHLARAVGRSGRVVLLDLDPENLQYAAQRVQAEGVSVDAVHASFADVARVLAARQLRAHVVLADLGFSSTQMDDAQRGFSFLRDGPLDMRLNPRAGETAAQLLARLSERELADAIYQFGEDPFARRIARAIVAQRALGPIASTQALADVVKRSYGARARDSRMHPATRTFMALRIVVNGELGALQHLLAATHQAAHAAGGGSPSWLERGGRMAVISFHSLEDRLVKHGFAAMEKAGIAERLTRKPVTAADDEIAINSRARSAKMRAVRVV
jgi:16S rRNA (cytosine1402-N4)-methyltransferase